MQQDDEMDGPSDAWHSNGVFDKAGSMCCD